MDEKVLESVLLLKFVQDTENISVKDSEIIDPGTGEECVCFVVQIFFGNETGTDTHGEEPFPDQLIRWSQFWNTTPSVDVLFMVPKSFPKSPPYIRLIRPVLEHGTGGVVNGVFSRVPRLFEKGWDSNYELPVVIPWIRDCLLKHRAKIDMNTPAMYNSEVFLATMKKIRSLPCAQDYHHKSKYQKEHIVYSGSFAATYFHATLPQGFEYGNKVLLHTSALEEILRHEMSYLGESGSTSLELGHTNESNTDDSAMIFELVSHLGFPVYCGVREFIAPEPDIVIVPTEMLLSMGVPEGSKVQLTRISLPQITSIVVQPHSSAFLELESSNGIEPREFLEDSLTRYSVLAKGDTALFDGGIAFSEIDIGIPVDGEAEPFPLPPLVYRFTIVSIEPPDTPAGALFSQFASTIDYKMLPPLDSYLLSDKATGPTIAGDSGIADNAQVYNPALDTLLQQHSAESTSLDDDIGSFLPESKADKPQSSSSATDTKRKDAARAIRGITFAPAVSDSATDLISRTEKRTGVSSTDSGQMTGQVGQRSSAATAGSNVETPEAPVDRARQRELRAKAAMDRLAQKKEEKEEEK